MRVVDDNGFVMRLPVFMISLAQFLSGMSEIAMKFGINNDDFIDELVTAIKYVNELKDRKRNN